MESGGNSIRFPADCEQYYESESNSMGIGNGVANFIIDCKTLAHTHTPMHTFVSMGDDKKPNSESIKLCAALLEKWGSE